MHGQGWYPIDTHWLSVLPWGGMNCFSPMPFARNARIEFEAGPEDGHIYLQVDWHRYPGQTLNTSFRFCARWRRECPTASYGEQYLLMRTFWLYPGHIQAFGPCFHHQSKSPGSV
jgi:hypothetical protein